MEISCLAEMSLSCVSIELDCKQVWLTVSEANLVSIPIWCYLNSCKFTSLGYTQNFKIICIRKQVNNVVHLLTRAALSYACFQCPR